MKGLMADLFIRDLSLSDFDALIQQVEQSPQTAMRLASLAEAAYRRTGLPEPHLARSGARFVRRSRWISRGASWGPWMPVLVLGFALAGSSMLLIDHLAAEHKAQNSAIQAVELLPPPPLPASSPKSTIPAQRPQIDVRTGRDQVYIRLESPRNEKISLLILDIQGGLRRRLHQGRLENSQTEFIWDQRDQAGELVEPGIYYISMAHASGEEKRALEIELR